MHEVDSTVSIFLNGFAHRWPTFDHAVVFLAHNHLLKGGLVAALLWWAWFRGTEGRPQRRASVVATLLVSVFAMVVARTLALSLPFRLRPLHEGALGFVPPHGMDPTYLHGWSSFPSDHAVLFFTLATGLMFVSRRAGVLTVVYAIVAIALPRLYLGLHYLSDILVGAAIGVVCALAANLWARRSERIETVVHWSETRPGLFYTAFFLVTSQIAEMFESSRALASAVGKLVRALFA